MIERLNRELFLLMNATADSQAWAIQFATWLARDLIFIVSLLALVLWLWDSRRAVPQQRVLVMKVTLAIALSLALSWLLGQLFLHPRPFVEGLGLNLLHHAPDESWPSDHDTVIFTFALAFLYWHRLWSGAVMMVIACAIAWSRVYLGVHWPLDMLGSLLVGMVACLSVDILWSYIGARCQALMLRAWRVCFAIPIRKGWVRD